MREYDHNYKALLKVRHLLTKLVIEDFDSSLGTGADYIDKFTNLRELMIAKPYGLGTFEKLLPVLQKSALLKLSFCLPSEDANNFLDKYLATKTEAKQTQLVDNISTIGVLELDNRRGINGTVYSLISRYMPMLADLEIRSNSYKD